MENLSANDLGVPGFQETANWIAHFFVVRHKNPLDLTGNWDANVQIQIESCSGLLSKVVLKKCVPEK